MAACGSVVRGAWPVSRAGLTVQFIFPGVVDARGLRETVRRLLPEIERSIRRVAQDQGLQRPV